MGVGRARTNHGPDMTNAAVLVYDFDPGAAVLNTETCSASVLCADAAVSVFYDDEDSLSAHDIAVSASVDPSFELPSLVSEMTAAANVVFDAPRIFDINTFYSYYPGGWL